MAASAPTTDELRAELIAEVATLGAELVAVRAEIIASEQALRALADDPDAMHADKVRAANALNRSLHARSEAARKERADALRLLRGGLPTPMDPDAFAAAAAAGQVPGVSDALRFGQLTGRPGLPDVVDATLAPLSDEQLAAERDAWRAQRGRR